MGDRSNINIIQSKKESGGYHGINLYSHAGGLDPQLKALAAIAKGSISSAEGEWGFTALLRALLTQDHDVVFKDAWSTTKISQARIMSVRTLREAEFMHLDNQHPILAIDFVNDRIVYGFGEQDMADTIVPFTEAGAERLYSLIEERIRPEYRRDFLNRKSQARNLKGISSAG